MRRILLALFLSLGMAAPAAAVSIDSMGVWGPGNNGWSELQMTAVGQIRLMKFKTPAWAAPRKSDSIRISARSDAAGIIYLKGIVYPLNANDSTSDPGGLAWLDTSQTATFTNTGDAFLWSPMLGSTFQPSTWYGVAVWFQTAQTATTCHVMRDSIYQVAEFGNYMSHLYTWTDALPLDATAPSWGTVGDQGSLVTTFTNVTPNDIVMTPIAVKIMFSAIGGPVPSVPTLSSPTDNATGIAPSPTLTWNTASGATTYNLVVSDASDFSSIIYNGSGLTATSQQVNLTGSTTYYWHVRATNTNGNSAFSTARSFTTASSGPRLMLHNP